MSTPSDPKHEAGQSANLASGWLGTPSDGSATKLFINQQDAEDFQANDPDATVAVCLGVTNQDTGGPINEVGLFETTTYQVTGNQPPRGL